MAEPKSKKVTFKLTERELSNAELAKGRVTEYEVPGKELHLVHVELEQTDFGVEGEKVSKPFVQKFEERAWLQFRKVGIGLGYKHCRVLHAPANIKGDNLTLAKVGPHAKK